MNLVGLRDRKRVCKPHLIGAGGMMTFLNPTEEDRLRIFLVAELARRTRALGLRLNAPEAVALIADEMHFAARAGKDYDEVVTVGVSALTPEQVMDGVADIVTQIRVEVLLEEGSRLIVLTHPIGTGSRATASASPVGERA
jgi:urease subunit gamma/beta